MKAAICYDNSTDLLTFRKLCDKHNVVILAPRFENYLYIVVPNKGTARKTAKKIKKIIHRSGLKIQQTLVSQRKFEEWSKTEFCTNCHMEQIIAILRNANVKVSNLATPIVTLGVTHLND